MSKFYDVNRSKALSPSLVGQCLPSDAVIESGPGLSFYNEREGTQGSSSSLGEGMVSSNWAWSMPGLDTEGQWGSS